MSSFVMTFPSDLRFFAIILVKFLILLKFSSNVNGTIPMISSSVANYICSQQSHYQESSQIQPPLKTKPENDDSTCSWFLWTKCKSDSETQVCPSFVLKTCEELGMDKKKGKGIKSKPPRDILPPIEPQPCDNSTEKGLPNPQIVPSMSKYPSVVTIEIGDRCQKKHCSGLILDQNWVIVHQSGCFYQYQPEHSDYHVIVAGERRMYVEEGTEQKRNVAEFIPHPGFKPEEAHYYKDNIGLVRVSAPFEFNENVQPIDLAAIEAIAPSIPTSNLTFVGWLYEQPMKEDQEMLSSLIESSLDFVPIEECYNKEMEGDDAARDSLICAGQCVLYGKYETLPRKSILFAQELSNSESAPVPVGIGPINHKIKPQHGVFLNLASYISWIKETVEGHSSGQGQGQISKRPESEPESRIAGGEASPPYKYKSMVNIELYLTYACTVHLCGGSILTEEWFLTAEHCVSNFLQGIDSYRIVVGDHDISDSDENEQVVDIVKVIPHENANDENDYFDIAVVKVSPPFKFNDKVQKVTLPDSSFQIQGLLTAIGWGLTENDTYPHILRQVETPFVPLDECQKAYEDSGRIPREGQICAGDETHAVCFTDSGGPLYDESVEQIVVGLVSYGGTVCDFSDKNKNDISSITPVSELKSEPEPFVPNVFTDVRTYVDWIRKNAEMDN